MSRTQSSWRRGRKVVALGGALAVGALALLQASAVAAPMPVTAPVIPGAPKLFGPVVDAGSPVGHHGGTEDDTRRGAGGHEGHDLGNGAAGRQGGQPRLDDCERPLRPRPEARQPRLHRAQGRQDRGRAGERDHRRERRVQGDVRGPEGLRRTARHLRRDQREAGRQGRLPARADGQDQPGEGARWARRSR